MYPDTMKSYCNSYIYVFPIFSFSIVTRHEYDKPSFYREKITDTLGEARRPLQKSHVPKYKEINRHQNVCNSADKDWSLIYYTGPKLEIKSKNNCQANKCFSSRISFDNEE